MVQTSAQVTGLGEDADILKEGKCAQFPCRRQTLVGGKDPTLPVHSSNLFLIPDVQRSAVGLLFWIIVLTTWISIFQTHRAEWGALGDYLSFTIPLGIP